MSNIMIVLCRPSEAGNVGAVCRAMKNMGLSSLRLVAPEPFDRAALLARAIHADDVWRHAGIFGTLDEAVADCALVVGTTARRGRKRKTSMRPRELAAWLAKRRWSPQQTQCFIPTPGTVASAMFYSGLNDEGKPIPVARSDAERLRQHGLLAGAASLRRAKPGCGPS